LKEFRGDWVLSAGRVQAVSWFGCSRQNVSPRERMLPERAAQEKGRLNLRRQFPRKKDAHFWLSFSDPDAPRGKRILGVAIVDIDTDASAVEISGIRGSLVSIRAGLSQSQDLKTGAHCASQESTETSRSQMRRS
jgi:hypothetical protein